MEPMRGNLDLLPAVPYFRQGLQSTRKDQGMTDSTTDFAQWIGRREVTEDDLGLAPALAAAAMLDDTATRFAKGSALPALWHWFYFLPKAPQAQLDVDGHPRRGGFMPPIPFPRRMFAGARLRFHRALVIGRPARRESVISSSIHSRSSW